MTCCSVEQSGNGSSCLPLVSKSVTAVSSVEVSPGLQQDSVVEVARQVSVSYCESYLFCRDELCKRAQ